MTVLYPLLVVAVLVFLSLVSWRLKRAAQPLRLEMADVGERLLANPKLPTDAKGYVQLVVQSAFSFRLELLMLVVGIPLIGLALLFFPRKMMAMKQSLKISDAETKSDINAHESPHF